MTSPALEFERPPALEARRTPEARGIARDEVRLLVSGPGGPIHASFRDLPHLLERGTLLVVNRSATIAASLAAHGPPGAFRLNLSTRYGGGIWVAEPRWSSARPGPLPIERGDRLVAGGLRIRAISPHPGEPRLWFVSIDGDANRAMANHGEPIRYGHLAPPYPSLAEYQTIFAVEPGSVEMPSAARPFTPRLVEALRTRGVRIARVTLHTGVSSLEIGGERVEDHELLPEPFSVSPETAAEIAAARTRGSPVIAVGTSVVRALESAWSGGRVRPMSGFTRRYVRPGRGVRVVDGLVTGFHDPRASHLALLAAISGWDAVRDAYAEALREGYLWHEFGDSHLILPGT